MNKVRKNFSLPVDVVQQMDRNWEDGHKSQNLADLLRKQFSIEGSKDEELARQLEELKEEKEDLVNERNQIDAEIDDIESQIGAIEYSLEKEEEKNDLLEDALSVLIPEWKKYRRNLKDSDEAMKRLKSSQKFGMWEEKLPISDDELASELWERIEDLGLK